MALHQHELDLVPGDGGKPSPDGSVHWRVESGALSCSFGPTVSLPFSFPEVLVLFWGENTSTSDCVSSSHHAGRQVSQITSRCTCRAPDGRAWCSAWISSCNPGFASSKLPGSWTFLARATASEFLPLNSDVTTSGSTARGSGRRPERACLCSLHICGDICSNAETNLHT